MIIAVFAMAVLVPPLAIGESTQLCEADEESKCASPVEHAHYFSNDLEVKAPEMTYKCDTLLLVDVSKLESPQVLEGYFTYSNCNNNCTRVEEGGPSVIYVLKTESESAEATGESLVHVDCSGFINCRYTLKEVTAIVAGPLISSQDNGEISFPEQELTHESGFLCPLHVYLYITFEPLSEIYISS